MAFVKLTKQDNGKCVYLATDKIVAVTQNTTGYYERPDGTLVLTSTGVCYTVKESPETVMQIIKEA